MTQTAISGISRTVVSIVSQKKNVIRELVLVVLGNTRSVIVASVIYDDDLDVALEIQALIDDGVDCCGQIAFAIVSSDYNRKFKTQNTTSQ